MRRLRSISAAALLVLAACGDDDTATDPGSDGAARTVEVDMVDIAFEPDALEVAVGETVRFVFTNSGTTTHDAFIGDAAAQADHEHEMREAPEDDEHGGNHDDDAVTVEPGQTGELTHTFDQAGTLEIGCHQEGHYAAGMTITVEVA